MMDILHFIAHYFALPVSFIVCVLELWLTKQRAKRFQDALEKIANDPFEGEYDKVRAQRDRCMNIARHTLYDEPNLPRHH